MTKRKEQSPKAKVSTKTAIPPPSWVVIGDSKATAAEIRDKYGFSPSLRFCEDLIEYVTKKNDVQPK